jgi:PHB accumulation regulatory protein
VHPRAIDPCQSWHGTPAGPHVTKTIAGAAETAYFDGAVVSGRGVRASGDPRMAPSEPVLIKRNDGRRLYRPDAGTYLTLDDLATMVEDDTAFTVREAATGEDITPSTLKQIIG